MNEIATTPAATAAACARCGSTPRPPRLTLRWLLRRAREDVFGLERGLLPTAGHLLVAPERVVRDYLAGAPARYYGPFKYFLIATALSLLLMPDAPFFDQGFARMLSKHLGWPEARATGFVQDWNALLYTPFVALLALAMRGFFRARPLNLAEHLVIVLYGWSQMLLLGTTGLLLAAGLKSIGIRGAPLIPILLLAPAYWLWFVGRVLRLRSVPDWLRALAALPGALALFLLLILAALPLLARLA